MSRESNISLETTHKVLGWPASANVTHPKGAGASVFASLVRGKIGRALQRFPEAQDAQVGVLMADPDASTSEPPLAIVAEFHSGINDQTLRELHRLSWNFSHAPTLITIEPTLLRVWSCCEAPDLERHIDTYLVQSLSARQLEIEQADDLEARAARALHWINLVSGQFFAEHSARFNRDGRADQMLLENLRYLREELARQGLVNDDICHDLLARVIFVQFLFDRKDQDGNPALTVARLHRLQKEGILQNTHSSFNSVLLDYEDTYRLFDWLNAKFNGDLFPGKGDSPEDRAQGWAKEKEAVEAKHLSLLAEFIRGDLDMPAQQMCLWPQYAFDVIPLEFISSIYEAFVTERASRDGIFYTPPYLVDFVLDHVLPWDGTDWDLKIIDPACGSGIFLVKSFQRLVHRWKLSNPGEPVRAETLRYLLARNIFGVDKDPHAVRVACFSLYLAMCDEIEPRHYWTQVTFPPMRQRRLVCSDFFSEDQKGFDTKEDAQSYDLVVGNAPWGKGVITNDASAWATGDDREWTIPNNDIGGLFLAKGAQLVSENGRIALIQSANSLLFNISSKASDFRRELFSSHRVEQIYNLSALRFRVFKRKTHTTKKSVAPACVVILRREQPSLDDTIAYVSPKHLRPLVDEFTIVIEPQDRRALTVHDAIADPLIWSKLMWGNARDHQLLKRFQAFPTLADADDLLCQQGLKFGDRTKAVPELSDMRIFNATMFPGDSFPFLDVADFPLLGDVKVHSRASTSLEAFVWPQLILKQSWNKRTARFHARLSRSEKREGILCSESYYSIHHTSLKKLETACMVFNSVLAVYFLLLTSGRFVYRPKPSKSELLGLPIPEMQDSPIENFQDRADLDARVFELFGLKDAERVLIEDALEYTLDDFLGGDGSKGKQSTSSGDPTENEPHLRGYCEYFVRVLKAGFGNERSVLATVFRSPSESMPYRLIAFELGDKADNTVEVKNIRSNALLEEFERLNQKAGNTNGGIFNQRVARIYDASSGVPTVFVVKPDQKRFWTRSMGMQDGDEVALDLFRWQQQAVPKDEVALH